MKFKIYRDQAGLYRWKLVSRNGRIVADSGEGYSKRNNATRAARNLNYELIMLGHFVEVVHVPD